MKAREQFLALGGRLPAGLPPVSAAAPFAIGLFTAFLDGGTFRSWVCRGPRATA